MRLLDPTLRQAHMRPMRRGNSGKIVPGDFDSHIGPRAVVAQFPVKNRPETGSLPPRLFLHPQVGPSLDKKSLERCPPMTARSPQVGFTRLAAPNSAQLGLARVAVPS